MPIIEDCRRYMLLLLSVCGGASQAYVAGQVKFYPYKKEGMHEKVELAGVKIKFIFVGASRAPSLRHLGALIRTCGLCCRNVNRFVNVYVLTPEISRSLSGPYPS